MMLIISTSFISAKCSSNTNNRFKNKFRNKLKTKHLRKFSYISGKNLKSQKFQRN